MSQMKKQDKTPEKELSEMKVSNLLEKSSKHWLQDAQLTGEKKDEASENFNKKRILK